MWKRLGIVLTVLWFIGCTLAIARDGIYKQQDANQAWFSMCMDDARIAGSGASECLARRTEDENNIDRAYYWKTGMTVAVAYAVVAWIIAYIAFIVGRWVLAGRKPKDAAPE